MMTVVSRFGLRQTVPLFYVAVSDSHEPGGRAYLHEGEAEVEMFSNGTGD